MSDIPGPHWDEEEDADPVVRLYALTRGRSRTTASDLTLDTMVVDVGRALADTRGDPEYAQILGLSRTSVSVAEISAQIGVPLTLTKVLIGDLIADGNLAVRSPSAAGGDAGELGILRAIAGSLRGS